MCCPRERTTTPLRHKLKTFCRPVSAAVLLFCVEEGNAWVKYREVDLKWKSTLSCVLSTVELLMFRVHCQLDTTCSHRRREHTEESLGHIVPWASLWEIVSITLIQVGRPPIVGGTIPLVSVLDCVNVERGLHTNRNTWIHSHSALDCGHDTTKCFKFLPQPPKIMGCDPKRWHKKPFSLSCFWTQYFDTTTEVKLRQACNETDFC